jgi:hypothetical protein
MERDNLQIGQLVRILTKWHDVPVGTLGTIETVTSRWDGRKIFTVCWHTQGRKKRLFQDTFWETDLARFECVPSERIPSLPMKSPASVQIDLPFKDDWLLRGASFDAPQ